MTILNQDRKALLHQQRGIKNNQAKTQRQHIVTRTDFEKVSNPLLRDWEIMSALNGLARGFFLGDAWVSSRNSPSRDVDPSRLRSLAQPEPSVWNTLEDDVNKMLVSQIRRDLDWREG